MNPVPYFKAFAWLALIALGLSIATDFWIPMLLGAVGMFLLIRLLKA